MSFVEDLFFKIRGENRLLVRHVEEDCVSLPLAKLKLYGFRLESKSDVFKTADVSLLRKFYLVKDLTGAKYLFVVFVRHKHFGFYRTQVYFFTYSKGLADVIKTNFGSSVVGLSGEELANVLYKLLLIEYPVSFDEKTGVFTETTNYFKSDQIVKRFPVLTAEVDHETTTCFVGCNFVDVDPRQVERILKTPWTGVLYVCLHLDDQLDNVKRKLSQAARYRTGLADLKEKLEKKEVEVVGTSLYFFTKDQKTDYVLTLFQNLGFVPLKKEFGKKHLVLATPFLMRDPDYLFQIPLEVASAYVPVSFCKTTLPKKILIYGRNRFGNFVGFNNFEECDNPHVMLFAPSGAGKSFFLQNFISYLLRVNVGDLLNGKDLPSLSQDVLIRHFDKGFSADLFYKLLKHRGYDVVNVSPRIDEMAYNVCEVEEEEDYDFSLMLVNAFLESVDQEPLQGLERVFYLRSLKEIYRRPEYVSTLRKEVGDLRQFRLSSFEEVYEKLRRLGYKDHQLIEEVKEKEFSFLKKATLYDVVRVLGQSKDHSLTSKEKEALESTIVKVEILTNYDLISQPATFNFKSTRFFYFDYELVYGHDFFVPLFLALLKKLVFVDKFYKKEEDLAFYFIDEAHNLFRKPVFAELLNVLVREARKYRISLVFATQNFVDIPPSLIVNADTKMFLAPSELTSKLSYLRELAKHVDVPVSENDVGIVYADVPYRQLTVWYRDGVFSLLLDVDDAKLKVFDSYRKKLPLPEGIFLKKGSVLEEEEEEET